MVPSKGLLKLKLIMCSTSMEKTLVVDVALGVLRFRGALGRSFIRELFQAESFVSPDLEAVK